MINITLTPEQISAALARFNTDEALASTELMKQPILELNSDKIFRNLVMKTAVAGMRFDLPEVAAVLSVIFFAGVLAGQAQADPQPTAAPVNIDVEAA